jgi:hypothetical protein
VKPSERIRVSQCSPWGRCRRGSGAIPVGWSPEFAGEGWGGGLGTARDRFGVLDRAVAAPARQLGGARECGRGGGCSRRGCGQCAVTGGGGGSRGC